MHINLKENLLKVNINFQGKFVLAKNIFLELFPSNLH